MSLRRLLSRVLAALLPLAIAATVYLYLYPVFQGCAFPLPTQNGPESLVPRSFLSTVRQHLAPSQSAEENPAIFRLLVLADPQLEGDSSLPKPENQLPARLRKHWTNVKSSAEDSDSPLRDVLSATKTALRELVVKDFPRALDASRKRIDLVGNDYYLAHIYRTLHWWSRPTHVTVLGDLIGSQWVTDEEFDRRGGRYWDRVFKGGERVSDEITETIAESPPAAELEALNATPSAWSQRIINIVGNHDVGYAGDASEARIERFERVFGRANWDIRFQHPQNQPSDGMDTSSSTEIPTLHIINLNTLILDTPALSPDVQSASYDYINNLITKRTYPVEDRTTFTLLLTHLPLHKREGICTDGPHFTFYDDDDDKDVPRFKEGGLREQNHLSQHVSSSGVLQGIFGLTGDAQAAGAGRGRNGLILTGHDHTGCDVVHFVDRSAEEVEEEVTAEEEKESGGDEKKAPEWRWNARRYGSPINTSEEESSPSIREVTLRSMMGEYGGNAGLLSLWFDADPAVNEWKYEITMCPAGKQHIWWTVHITNVVAVVLVLVYFATGFLESESKSKSEPKGEAAKTTKVEEKGNGPVKDQKGVK